MRDSTLFVIAGLILVLVIFAGLFFVFRQWIRRVLVKRILEASIILADHRCFDKKKKDIQLLLLGACEFREGIDEKRFTANAFNFSVPSTGFIELYYFLKHYIGKMPSLKALVLSVGDNSFCTKTSNGSTFPVLFNKFIDYEELMLLSSSNWRLKLWWQRWLYSSSVGHIHYGRKHLIRQAKQFIFRYTRKFHIQNLKRVFRQRVLYKVYPASKKSRGLKQKELAPARKDTYREKQKGLGGGKDTALVKSVLKEKKSIECVDIASVREGVLTHFSRPTFDEKALVYFEKILKLCQSKSTPVITVCMPRSKYFLKVAEEEGYVTEKDLYGKIIHNPIYKDLIYEHLHYLNIYRDRDDLFSPNGVELNRGEGRKVFSMRLAEDINSIMQNLGF